LAKLICFNEKLGGGTLTLIDCDDVEDHNLARVFGPEGIGSNKAELLAEFCESTIPSGNLDIKAIPEALSPDTLHRYHREWNKDGVVIFGCVDNHVSRVYMENIVADLKSGTLISAGNSYHEGQAQLYIRKDGEDVTPRITTWAPEILVEGQAWNHFPDDEDCSQEYESAPQLILANQSAAIAALNLYYSQCLLGADKKPSANEVTFDIKEGGAFYPNFRDSLVTSTV
jgi:hypothetical protein